MEALVAFVDNRRQILRALKFHQHDGLERLSLAGSQKWAVTPLLHSADGSGGQGLGSPPPSRTLRLFQLRSLPLSEQPSLDSLLAGLSRIDRRLVPKEALLCTLRRKSHCCFLATNSGIGRKSSHHAFLGFRGRWRFRRI